MISQPSLHVPEPHPQMGGGCLKTDSDAPPPPNLRFRRFFATSRVTTLRAWCPLRELNGQLTKIVAWGRGGAFQYTNSANPALSAWRRLTCPPCNECGRDKNLTDGQNIFDVFTFSKYFASFLRLITFPSRNYLFHNHQLGDSKRNMCFQRA